ncbi:hypothetical protein [Microbacterium lacticum]|nr:hypothetical protein [Microbacterium lacticum]
MTIDLDELEQLAHQRDHGATSAERINAANAILDLAEREGMLGTNDARGR